MASKLSIALKKASKASKWLSDTNDELRELREELGHKRDLLIEQQEKFSYLSKSMTDGSERMLAEAVSRLSLVLVDVYRNLDYLWLGSLASKAQTEILLNMILDLPEMKENPALMEKVRKAFADYAAKFQRE